MLLELVAFRVVGMAENIETNTISFSESPVLSMPCVVTRKLVKWSDVKPVSE